MNKLSSRTSNNEFRVKLPEGERLALYRQDPLDETASSLWKLESWYIDEAHALTAHRPASLMPPVTVKHPPESGHGKSVPQAGKQQAIYLLSCIRIATLLKSDQLPNREATMRLAKIGEKKLKQYAYDLWYYWDTLKYREVWEYDEDRQEWKPRPYNQNDVERATPFLAE